MRFDRLAQLLIQQNLLLSEIPFRQVSGWGVLEERSAIPDFENSILTVHYLPLHYFLAKMELE